MYWSRRYLNLAIELEIPIDQDYHHYHHPRHHHHHDQIEFENRNWSGMYWGTTPLGKFSPRGNLSPGLSRWKYKIGQDSRYHFTLNFKSEISIIIINHIHHPKVCVSYKDELEEVARGWGVVVERVEVICC